MHAIDNLGGKLGSFDRLQKELAEGEAWSAYDRALGGGAYFARTNGDHAVASNRRFRLRERRFRPAACLGRRSRAPARRRRVVSRASNGQDRRNRVRVARRRHGGAGRRGLQVPGWSFEFDRGDEGNKFKMDEVLESEALLLGRKTYEGFAAAWPSREGDFADKFNNMPKYVVSSTLERSRVEQHDRARGRRR